MERTMRVAAVLAAVVLTGLGGNAAGGELRVVRFTGAGRGYNYFLTPFAHSLAMEGQPPALAVRDGDLLAFGDWSGAGDDDLELLFRYRAADGDELKLAREGGRLTLAGKTIAVCLPGEDGRAWVMKAGAGDLRTLRTVQTELGDVEADALKRIVAANPTVDLMIEEPGAEGRADDPWSLVAGARPECLFVSDRDLMESEKRDRRLLASVRVHVTAMEPIEESEESYRPQPAPWLSQMPRLERLLLVGGLPPAKHLPGRLKALGVLFGQKTPLEAAAVRRLRNLEELVLVGVPVRGFEAVAGLKRLRFLSLAAVEDVGDLSTAADLPLKWLSVPAGISQEEFAEAVAAYPALEGIELQAAEKVQDLAPLKGHDRLRVLILGQPGEAGLPEGLEAFDDLELLVLPAGLFENDPGRVAALREALPETQIVPGAGICLGSGWILLLVPVAAGAAAVSAVRRHRGQRERRLRTHG
jgi:hypothetical protein